MDNILECSLDLKNVFWVFWNNKKKTKQRQFDHYYLHNKNLKSKEISWNKFLQ